METVTAWEMAWTEVNGRRERSKQEYDSQHQPSTGMIYDVDLVLWRLGQEMHRGGGTINWTVPLNAWERVLPSQGRQKRWGVKRHNNGDCDGLGNGLDGGKREEGEK